MNGTSRSRLLGRARATTVGIVVAAATGTAALTAVASHATAQGDTSPSGGTSDLGGRSGTSGRSGSTGVVPAPSTSQPQGGSNAS